MLLECLRPTSPVYLSVGCHCHCRGQPFTGVQLSQETLEHAEARRIVAPPRFDAPRTVQQVNALTGADLVLAAYAVEGSSGGAAYVRWPDGRQSVISLVPREPGGLARDGSILSSVRQRGAPVPQYELVVPVDGGTALVQECLPGTPPGYIGRAHIDKMIQVTESFAHLLPGRSDAPQLNLHLCQSGRQLYWHETLASYDRRTRRLLAQVQEIAGGSELVPGDDLVHMDFTPGNILFDVSGQVSGLVDWHGLNGLARGDRYFGLVVLRFDLAWGSSLDPNYPGVNAAGLGRLDDVLGSLPVSSLRRYWASMSLRMVDWTIRACTPAAVDHQLAFAATRLG
jgi:hypothetical protein